MRAYSLDLRQKVVAAYERGEATLDEVAALFSVGPTFVIEGLREVLRKKAGVEVRQPTVSRVLARLNLPRKKNSSGERAK